MKIRLTRWRSYRLVNYSFESPLVDFGISAMFDEQQFVSGMIGAFNRLQARTG